MLPVPVNPHWYQAYWMTERPPRHRPLIALLRRLRRWLTVSRAKPRSRVEPELLG